MEHERGVQAARLSAEAVRGWNARFLGHLEAIAAVHPPRGGFDLPTLANMMSCVVDGGIITSEVLGDPGEIERQVLAYRAMIRLVFGPGQAG